MLKLKQAIIVEGKYDKIRLQSVVDATIIVTNGFSIYKDKEKLELIRKLASEDGIIILTDSDGAGFQIRNYLKGCISDGKIYNVYIPDIYGKEKRKDKPSKAGTLGVEGISSETLEKAFIAAGITTMTEEQIPPEITREMLLNDGYIGSANSSFLRKKLQNELNLPEKMSTKMLLDILNRSCDKNEYIKLTEKIKGE